MLAKLRQIRQHAQANMACFVWTAYSAQEVREMGNPIDPACAMLQGKMGPVTVILDKDGEFHISAPGYLDVLPTIDMKAKPADIAATMAVRIRSVE